MPQGRILFVDLSSGKIETLHPEPTIYQRFLGGYGLGVWFITENQPPKVDPLSEESIFGVVPGLLNGTGIPFSSRSSFVGKSPLTGTWGDSNVGGFIGPQIKKAGFDGIFFRGVSSKPVYFWVEDGKAQIRDASHLWGRDTYQTQEILRMELGGDIAVACIGQAGERVALSSCIIHDRGRAGGRSGLGALMGSKRLKAIAVRGKGEVLIAHPSSLEKLKREIIDEISPKTSGRFISIFYPILIRILPLIGIKRLRRWGRRASSNIRAQLYHRYGTVLGLSLAVESGATPIKNWSGSPSLFPIKRSRKISDEAVVSHVVRDYGCADCPVRCGGEVKVKEGFARRPEYEVLGSLGSLLLNDDLKSIMEIYHQCNLYGIDVIEVGSSIAWAIEAFERGIITTKDTGGIRLGWGEVEGILGLAELIFRGEGIGEALANGVAYASKVYGGEDFAIHISGQAPGMWQPSYNPYYGLVYISDPTPGRHTAGSGAFGDSIPLNGIDLSSAGVGERQKLWSSFAQVLNSLGLCYFHLNICKLPLLELIYAVCGWRLSALELLKIGKEIQTLRHLFNLREGRSVRDFVLPERLCQGLEVSFDEMRGQYFEAMGWDRETGIPL